LAFSLELLNTILTMKLLEFNNKNRGTKTTDFRKHWLLSWKFIPIHSLFWSCECVHLISFIPFFLIKNSLPFTWNSI